MPGTGQNVHESLRHMDAFEYFYAQGHTRTYKRVAEKIGVSQMAVSKWARTFDWQTRVIERDKKNGAALANKTDTMLVNAKANYRKLITTAIEQFKDKLEIGEITIENVGDLEKLVKLDMLLIGEPTERSATTSGHEITDDSIKAAFRAIYREQFSGDSTEH